jgi:hypothetical protein
LSMTSRSQKEVEEPGFGARARQSQGSIMK